MELVTSGEWKIDNLFKFTVTVLVFFSVGHRIEILHYLFIAIFRQIHQIGTVYIWRFQNKLH